jgi:dienelactone hydrolase
MSLRAGLAGLLGGCALAGTAFAAPPLADYGKLPTVEQLSLSPAGDKIAFLGSAGDQRRIVVKKVGGPGLFAINVGTLKPRSVIWLDEGHLLVEATTTLGERLDLESFQHYEATQSTIIDATTGKAANVFAGVKLIDPQTYGMFGSAMEGGVPYGYFAGLTLTGAGTGAIAFDSPEASATHSHTDLYKVNLDNGHPEMVSGGSEYHDLDWVVGPTGVIAGHSDYDHRSHEWRLYADPADTILISQAIDPVGDINLVGFGRTPDTLLVQRPTADGSEYVYIEYPAKVGASGTVLFKDQGVRGLLWDPATHLLMGAETNDDNPQTVMLDPVLQAKFDKIKRALGGEIVTLVSTTAALDRMIIKAQGPGDSGTYFLVDYAAGKIEAMGWEYPTILQGDVAVTRTITYKAADGLELEGVLTLPLGREAKNAPLVVLPHGGPAGHDYIRFDWWAQALASRGYVVFQPNFRGSDRFGKAFTDAGDGQWGRKMQTDISDGVAELARQGIVDPKRACIVGASYGGYAALAGVTVQQGLYRCAVAVGGVSDLNDMLAWDSKRYGSTSEAMRIERKQLGVRGDGDGGLNAYSPRRLAAKADAPILLIYGKDDTVVSTDQSRYMADALRHAGKPVEVLQLPAEDHWLSKASTRTAMLEASVAFVQKNNPPDAAAVAAK